VKTKSTTVAYVLLLSGLGFLGVHQFYIGKIGRGIGYLLTGGWMGIGLFIDLFTLGSQVRTANAIRMAESAALPRA